MKISVKSNGGFDKTSKYFSNLQKVTNNKAIFDKYGQMGVELLRASTPIDSGKSANSWYYSVEQTKETISLIFHNSNNSVYNTPIVIYLQYGHATKNGGWVSGRDFINPAIKTVFDKLVNELWREVSKA